MNSQEINARDILKPYIYKDLERTGRCIIRGLGTFRVVEHKEHTNNLGFIKARKLVKFTATKELKELLNK